MDSNYKLSIISDLYSLPTTRVRVPSAVDLAPIFFPRYQEAHYSDKSIPPLYPAHQRHPGPESDWSHRQSLRRMHRIDPRLHLDRPPKEQESPPEHSRESHRAMIYG